MVSVLSLVRFTERKDPPRGGVCVPNCVVRLLARQRPLVIVRWPSKDPKTLLQEATMLLVTPSFSLSGVRTLLRRYSVALAVLLIGLACARDRMGPTEIAANPWGPQGTPPAACGSGSTTFDNPYALQLWSCWDTLVFSGVRL